MIRLRNIIKYYDKKIALNNLSMDFEPNSVNVLIGPSGCGKSSCLKLINRMENFQTGDIHINTIDIKEYDPIDLRRSIGYVIQQTGLFPHMTVFENITIIPRILKWSDDKKRQRYYELMELIGLAADEYKESYPFQLSGGEAQRVGVARALAANPDILLMDEPFGAVDPIKRSSLQEQFLSIQHKLKKTIIFVTHDMNEAIQMADKLFIMKDGQLIQAGRPEDILEAPVNEFVARFVGSDRAIKKLSLSTVESLYNSNVTHLVPGQNIPESCTYSWICNDQGIFMGWIDNRLFKHTKVTNENIVYVDLNESTVSKDTSIKTALSRLIASDYKTLAVLDKDKKLIGDISLETILNL